MTWNHFWSWLSESRTPKVSKVLSDSIKVFTLCVTEQWLVRGKSLGKVYEFGSKNPVWTVLLLTWWMHALNWRPDACAVRNSFSTLVPLVCFEWMNENLYTAHKKTSTQNFACSQHQIHTAHTCRLLRAKTTKGHSYQKVQTAPTHLPLPKSAAIHSS